MDKGIIFENQKQEILEKLNSDNPSQRKQGITEISNALKYFEQQEKEKELQENQENLSQTSFID